MDYSATAKRAAAMIAKYGVAATLTRTTEGAYDPATGATAESSVGTQSVTVVVLPASKGTVEAFDERFMSGSLVNKSLRLALLGAVDLSPDPAPGDRLTISGTAWDVIGATEVAPGGTALLWKLGIQR